MKRHRVLSLVLGLLLLSSAVAYAQQSPDVEPPEQSPPAAAVHVGPDSLYPDPSLTPGATFDGITADQVCVPGYATSVRDVTSNERKQVYAEYGTADVPGADEVDHFVSLELGGSNDIGNLWPEPYTAPGAHEKDRVENYLHDQVCSGALDLADAQQMITGDWYAVYLSLPVARLTPTPVSVLTIAPVVPTTAAAPTTSGVTFASVSGGPPGGHASVTISTAPGATCSIQYATPSGTSSSAQGLSDSKTAGQDGSATWSWDIGPSTRSGSGTVTASCSTGTATTPITID